MLPTLDQAVTSDAETVRSPIRSEEALLIEPADSVASHDGNVLIMAGDWCGIPDPAVDLASEFRPIGLRLVSEIHAGLTRITEQPEIRVEPELAESFRTSEGGQSV